MFLFKDKRLKSINKLQPKYKSMSNEQLQEESKKIMTKAKETGSVDKLTIDAFALCREACLRVLNKYPYDVQILGGLALHDGKIAEMKTGEGKTLTEVMPAYLNALNGKGVHIITVNDYLAERDMKEMGKVFNFLGMSVDWIYPDMELKLKQKAYKADILYGTNKEFGFDYLKDNLVSTLKETVQRGLNFVIIDEVDSVLIDEARTPLIISGQTNKGQDYYILADKVAASLKRGKDQKDTTKFDKIMKSMTEDNKITGDFIVDEKSKTVFLTDSGVEKVEKFFHIDNLGDPDNVLISHHIQQALKARYTMKANVDYLVKKGEVLIIDESTGRTMDGRRFSDGLHQALEAKERIKIKPEDDTKATITLQNYFKLYDKVSGMTGTAKTEEYEFKEFYGLSVDVIPTNKPMARIDMKDVVYPTVEKKYKGVLAEALVEHRKGRPVLIGTSSVEQSETLSKLFRRNAVKHEVLNAKNDEMEAYIVAQAGRSHAVTIATNMAGRGTDILLGGNPELMALDDLKKENIEESDIAIVTSYTTIDDNPELKSLQDYYFERLKIHTEDCSVDKTKVVKAGGLHVIGTQRHDSRRIDNQLRGRAGRQGDAGSSHFHLSLEDDMMRIHGGYQGENMFFKFKDQEDDIIEIPGILKFFDSSQKRVETSNYEIRKSVLDYDKVDDIQRSEIYEIRRELLEDTDVSNMTSVDKVNNMLGSIAQSMTENVSEGKYVSKELFHEHLETSLTELKNYALRFTPDVVVELEFSENKKTFKKNLETFFNELLAIKRSEAKDAGVVNGYMEKMCYLKALDDYWALFLITTQNLKESVAMTGYGTQKPLDVYKSQITEEFDYLLENIEEATLFNMMFTSFQVVRGNS